jgi:hypothetical protein
VPKLTKKQLNRIFPIFRPFAQQLVDHTRQHEDTRRAIGMFFFGRDYPVFGVGISCVEETAMEMAGDTMDAMGELLYGALIKAHRGVQNAFGKLDPAPQPPAGIHQGPWARK